jgi:hypothetical protein
MEQLTVQDVIKRAGGIKLINDTGISSDNKYMVHAEDCIKEQLEWAHVLKLNHLPLLDILEIGTGAGFFPYICREYGHYAESCDDVELGSRWAMGYKLLNIEPKSYYVYKNTSTEGIFEKKFDIITSFRSTIGTTTYIEHPDGTGDSSIDVWDVDEWKFFLKDCSKNLLKSDNSFICSAKSNSCPSQLTPHMYVKIALLRLHVTKTIFTVKTVSNQSISLFTLITIVMTLTPLRELLRVPRCGAELSRVGIVLTNSFHPLRSRARLVRWVRLV